MPLTNVIGKVAFVTGAASGIGFAVSNTLAREGMKVVMADIEESALEKAFSRLKDSGVEVSQFILDVTDRNGFSDARDFCLSQYGEVNLLVNNAGVNVAAPLYEVTYKDWDWVLGVNLMGVVNGLQEFLPILLESGVEAHIINIASVGGLVGMRGLGIYNASKFAVVGLSEALRADLESTKVGVSVVCPGIVSTELSSSNRNRPLDLKNSLELDPHDPVVSTDTQKPGTAPEDLAEQIFEGLKSGRFFINTHPEFGPVIAQRNRAVQVSFSSPKDKDLVNAMQKMVLPF